jgi:DNA-directed RNA polymerase specialized sigma24 family protein
MPVLRERGEGWLTALYSAHHPQVVRYVLRRLADPDAAAELAQEVFCHRVAPPCRGARS